MPLKILLNKIPIGYTRATYRAATWGISHTTFNGGQSGKLYAEQLGGNDFVSCNYYFGKTKSWLKPCEMPESKVLDFLQNVQLEQPTTPEE